MTHEQMAELVYIVVEYIGRLKQPGAPREELVITAHQFALFLAGEAVQRLILELTELED